MSIKVNFGLARLDKIIEELNEQIDFLKTQRDEISNKRDELAQCEKLIN